MKIAVEGVLCDPAEHRRTIVGDALLIVSFSTGYGFRFETRLCYGRTERDHMNAGRDAATLANGDPIVVEAMAAEPRTDHGHACIALRKLLRVTIGGRSFLPMA